MTLMNVTIAQFKGTQLENSFLSGIAVDLKVSEDQIVVTSLTASSGVRRRRLLEADSLDALAVRVAFKVTGEADVCLID